MTDEVKLSDLKINHFKELGKGYISKVYPAIHKKTNVKYAVKIIDLEVVSDEEL